jgi:hypothetical protein
VGRGEGKKKKKKKKKERREWITMSDFLFFFWKFCDVAEVVIIHKLILAKFG